MLVRLRAAVRREFVKTSFSSNSFVHYLRVKLTQIFVRLSFFESSEAKAGKCSFQFSRRITANVFYFWQPLRA